MLGLLGGGCAETVVEPDASALEVPDAVEIIDVPSTRDEFLAELIPLPEGPITIDYDVHGPGGIAGTMHVVLAEGGRRRENWSLKMPLPTGEVVAIEGAAIVTPDHEWNDAAEGAATMHALGLGGLADAYLAADEATRGSAIEHVRAWHQEIASGRQEHPGTRETVLGRPCLRSRVAGQSLCVWEDAGLPLAYRSDAFSLEATRIETRATLADDEFEIPAGAQSIASSEVFDPAAALEKVASGDLAQIIAVLQPSLRLPQPA